jgi:hypothetical protein
VPLRVQSFISVRSSDSLNWAGTASASTPRTRPGALLVGLPLGGLGDTLVLGLLAGALLGGSLRRKERDAEPALGNSHTLFQPFFRRGRREDLAAVPLLLADRFRACLANISKRLAIRRSSRLVVGCVSDSAALRASSARFCQLPSSSTRSFPTLTPITAIPAPRDSKRN